MGASPYWYFVPYEQDFNTALEKLREKEFKAGRYYPAVLMPEFPITKSTKSPGAKHASIEQAMEDAAENGTASILDMNAVSLEDDYCVARILPDEELIKLFGTDKPERNQVENNFELFDLLDRGKGLCIPIYKDAKPDELFFAGYSFD
jgi:hypothetical protein